MKPRLFLGSSSKGLSLLDSITASIQDVAAVHRWPDVFQQPNASFKDVLVGELATCHMAAFIVTADDELVAPKSAGRSRQIPRDNIIFEAGLAAGRYGFERTIIVAQKGVDLPSDWSGLFQIPLDYDPNEQASSLAGPIAMLRKAILDVGQQLEEQARLLEQQQSEGGYWYLTMVRVGPGHQVIVQDMIKREAGQYSHRHGVVCEKAAVLFGEYDDFLIFNAPSIEAATQFVTELRWGVPNITQVDTRQVFPGFYWKGHDSAFSDPRIEHLVLISCDPANVERVYEAIRTLPIDDPKREVVITRLGIIFGRHDIFMLASAPDLHAFDKFITDRLRSSGILGHLTDNTTSLRVGH